MSLKEIILSELDKRKSGKTAEKLSSIDTEIKRKEEELIQLKEKSNSYKDLKERSSFIIERDYGGVRTFVHKKDGQVRVFFDDGADVTSFFQNPEEMTTDLDEMEAFEASLVKQGVSLSESDFILDGCLVRGERDLILYVTDVLYLDKDMTRESLYNRKSALKKLSFTDNIKESPFIISKNVSDLKKSIDLFKEFDDSVGVVAKRYAGTYELGESDNWIFYRW